jgi:hypothetical protein
LTQYIESKINDKEQKLRAMQNSIKKNKVKDIIKEFCVNFRGGNKVDKRIKVKEIFLSTMTYFFCYYLSSMNEI